MKLRSYYIWMFLIAPSICFSQNTDGLLQGKVSFVTSNNVYVKFQGTENISIGDTLLLSRDSSMNACLLVSNKSSSSCVCSVINGCKLEVDDIIIHPSAIGTNTKPISEKKNLGINANQTDSNGNNVLEDKKKRESIKGRISAASYSSLSAERGDNHRMMYRFSLNANRINDSKFSLETYLNYRQNYKSEESVSLRKDKYFNVYNLALRYDVDSSLSLVVGRKINRNASSIGAIDGLQAEKSFGKFYTGIIAGFRPSISNYGFDSNLLEYGTYIGLKTENKKINSQSTLGLLEQKNKGSIDRRYTYFQHSSTLNGKINIFSSFELDLYNKLNGKSFNNARLTNLYISSGYRISRKVNVNLSYDSRKQILYYESLKTQIEQLLENDEARQGIRGRVIIRPFKYTSTGLSYSRRFQSSAQNKSDNINAYITLSKIPSIKGLISVNYNLNTSYYLESKILSIRHSRYLFKNKINAGFYFRMVNYNYLNQELSNGVSSYEQKYYGTNLSFRINKKLSISILGEIANISSENNYRINTRIIKRFAKK